MLISIKSVNTRLAKQGDLLLFQRAKRSVLVVN